MSWKFNPIENPKPFKDLWCSPTKAQLRQGKFLPPLRKVSQPGLFPEAPKKPDLGNELGSTGHSRQIPCLISTVS